MILARTRETLGQALRQARRDGRSVGLVPTMGYLHEGHLSLVDAILDKTDFLAASIFVNPLQFAPDEDLDRYPRNLNRDLELLEARGVDLVFHPPVEEMYPGGEPAVTVDPGRLGEVLCGAYRPGHFRGVLTVVARLFGLFRPRWAAFGRKDFQQAVLIRRMVRDLEMNVEILVGGIVRDEDGLAMSSRNVHLDAGARADALGLSRGLAAMEEAFSRGTTSARDLRETFQETADQHSGLAIQYLEVVHPETLESVDPVLPGSVAAVAGHCGGTRLIDNRILGP